MTPIRRAQERHGHSVFTSTGPGFAPGGAGEGKFLRDDGTYAAAGGGGGGAGAAEAIDDHDVVLEYAIAAETFDTVPLYVTRTGSSISDLHKGVDYSGPAILRIPTRELSGTGSTAGRQGYLNGNDYAVSMSGGFLFEWWFGWRGGASLRLGLTADTNQLGYPYKSVGVEVNNSGFARPATQISWVEDASSAAGLHDGATFTDTGWTSTECANAIMRLTLACDPGDSTVAATLWRSDTDAEVTRTMTTVPDSGVYGTYAAPYTLRVFAYYKGNGYAYGQYGHFGNFRFVVPLP